MVRMGEWKLIYDMMGYGQLYHLPTDPHELNNRFGQPDVAREQAALMAELTMWTIRTQDSLPTGPQNRKYQTKWARPHNWYAPYRRAPARSEEHTSELQSLMRISYAVFCLENNNTSTQT